MRKKMNWKTLFRRYDGETGAGGTGSTESTGSEGSDGSKGGTGTDDKGTDQPAKTFTQAEVNAMMAKEKTQGKLAILKELGIEDVKTAKEGITKYNEWAETQKTDLQKANDIVAAEKLAKETFAKENTKLQFKIDAMSFGVKPECVDAMAAIVAVSTTDGSDPKEVLKGLKEKPEYKGFFADGSGDDDSSGGTGTSVGSKKAPPVGNEGLGKRLGATAAKGTEKKSSYFSS